MNPSWPFLILFVACGDSCRVMPPESGDSRGETGESGQETGDTEDSGDTGDPNLEFACGTSEGEGLSPEVQTVVVLVTDGARIDETFGDKVSSVTGEQTEDFWPTIRSSLLPQGTLVLPGLATGVTITAEGHGALLTGSRVAQANFPSDDGPGMYRPEIPTIFERLRSTLDLPEDSTALVGNTVHLGGHGWSLHPGHGEDLGASVTVFTQDNGQPVGDDIEVIDGVQSKLEDFDIRLIVANLHQMDRSGHYNTNPSAYADGVKSVDEGIVDLWNWIQESEDYADQTLLVVVADHGRHRWNEIEDYRNHGDQCTGCRQIPMFMVGPGIRAGHQVDTTYTIEDVGRTLSWMLGIDLPHADGQILCEALTDPPETNGRGGVGSSSQAGSIHAEMRFGDTPRVKSQVYIGDELISTEDAIHAEAPRVWSAEDTDYICWRELAQGPTALDVVETWSWLPRCALRSSKSESFTEFTLPIDSISPYWVPALGSDASGNLLLAYADNQSGNWEAPDQAVRLLYRTGDDWQGMSFGIDAAYPLEPSIAVQDETAWVAFAASNNQTDPEDKKAGRFLRHIEVWRANLGLADSGNWTAPEWALEYRSHTVSDDGTTEPDPWDRMERPALHVDDQGIQLAFIGVSADTGNTVAWAASDSDGIWSAADALDDSGRALSHISPQFAGDGRVAWLRLGANETVELCAWAEAAPASTCVDTGEAYARDLSLNNAQASMVLSQGSGEWALHSLDLPEPEAE
jgi:hypothetical protein